MRDVREWLTFCILPSFSSSFSSPSSSPQVRQEDGTRDTFEKVFQDINHHNGTRELTWAEFEEYVLQPHFTECMWFYLTHLHLNISTILTHMAPPPP